MGALISSKLIKMIEKAGHGVHFLASITLAAISLLVFAFVDHRIWLLPHITVMILLKHFLVKYKHPLTDGPDY